MWHFLFNSQLFRLNHYIHCRVFLRADVLAVPFASRGTLFYLVVLGMALVPRMHKAANPLSASAEVLVDKSPALYVTHTSV